MDQNTSAVLLSLLVYTLYVLLPLIPSVIIYKMFPETKVTAEGQVSNWKIKAGGAFAAYVTVVLLGYFIVARTQDIIGGMSACAWTIHGQVALEDEAGATVHGTTLLKTLKVQLQPDIVRNENQVVNLSVPSQGMALPETTLSFSIPGFGEKTIDLEDAETQKQFDVDYHKRRIDFKKPIVIAQFPTPAGSGQAAPPTVAYQTPSNAPGPAPIPADHALSP